MILEFRVAGHAGHPFGVFHLVDKDAQQHATTGRQDQIGLLVQEEDVVVDLDLARGFVGLVGIDPRAVDAGERRQADEVVVDVGIDHGHVAEAIAHVGIVLGPRPGVEHRVVGKFELNTVRGIVQAGNFNGSDSVGSKHIIQQLDIAFAKAHLDAIESTVVENAILDQHFSTADRASEDRVFGTNDPIGPGGWRVLQHAGVNAVRLAIRGVVSVGIALVENNAVDDQIRILFARELNIEQPLGIGRPIARRRGHHQRAVLERASAGKISGVAAVDLHRFFHFQIALVHQAEIIACRHVDLVSSRRDIQGLLQVFEGRILGTRVGILAGVFRHIELRRIQRQCRKDCRHGKQCDFASHFFPL